MNKKESFTIKSNPKYLKEVREKIKSFLDGYKIKSKILYYITMAIDEAIMNVIEHSTDVESTKKIEVVFELDNDNNVFRCSIINEGKSFDFEKAGLVELDKHIEEKKESGLGVYLIKTLMDTVNYTSMNNKIKLEMSKHL